MADVTSSNIEIPHTDHPLHRPNASAKWFLPLFGAIVIGGLIYVGYALSQDLTEAKQVPWILLGLALLIALGFEFVNGFHDTANAVATVIYTHSMPAELAVIWSGFFNFLGVLTASGAVAFGIISLLPVELILQVSSGAGLAMVFALLVAAIIWNLGTWYLGLPASSSHTLIGSIIGVGLANQFLAPAGSATSGVDWSQATNVGLSLLISPIVGFVGAGPAAAGHEAGDPQQAALRGAEGRRAAAAVDPVPAHLHLHRGELRPRLERWPEGHGPHHADPDRRGAHRLRAQPHAGHQLSRTVQDRFGRGGADADEV